MKSLRERLAVHLLRESAAGAASVIETWDAPLGVRIAAGDALAGLVFHGWLGDAGRLRLLAPENHSRFREGDVLRLGSGDDPARAPEVTLVDEDPASGALILEPAWGVERADVAQALAPGRDLVLDRGRFDMTERLLGALERALAGSSPHARLTRRIIEGNAGVELDPSEAAHAEASVDRLAGAGVELTESQTAAFVAGWASRPLSLIQVPPGMGKTWLLGLLVAALGWRGERILLTAMTHRAIDNAILQVAEVCRAFGRRLDLVRVSPRRDARLALEAAGVASVYGARRVGGQTRGRGQVVAATILASLGLDEGSFDRVAVDEAAQVPLSHAPAALLAGRRWIFLGDDRQLGPVLVAEHRDDAPGRSVFEHLRGVTPPLLLDTTFRLNDELCAFPSKEFYGGRLRPAVEAAGRRFLPGERAQRFRELLAPAPSAVLAAIDHRGRRTLAPDEVELAADLATELLTRCELSADDLAVISPFRLQNQRIRRALASRLGQEAELPVIDTVERIQGQQREAVIVSLTCSDPDALRRDSRFFFSPRRLCVTLTRARTKLVVVGSRHLLDTLPIGLEGLHQVALFHRLFASLPQPDLPP